MKQTVEEAAYDYATNKTKFRKDVLKEVDADTYVSRHADSMDDFQCGAEWQSKQSPWISVKERLPEKDGYYFVTDGDVVEKVYFFKKWNKFTSTRDYPHLFYDEGEIKAWLHIPSFDDILEANRDVLERIKEKGD